MVDADMHHGKAPFSGRNDGACPSYLGSQDFKVKGDGRWKNNQGRHVGHHAESSQDPATFRGLEDDHC